jgi:hypothetical protein
LLKVIENVCNGASYKIGSDVILDHDDDEEFRKFEDKSVAFENENVDRSFDETVEGVNLATKVNFSLDCMRKSC